MEIGTAVIIEGKEYSKGTEVQIAGETFRVMNTYPQAQSIFFAKVLKSGKLASPRKGAMGSFSFDEIARLARAEVIA
jgi:hypothetical protein